MAQDNTISVSFSPTEVTKIKDAINAINDIAGVIQGKTISLNAKDRKTFGRVKYEKVVWIDKVKDQMDNNPASLPRFIDKGEFDRDYAAFKALSPLISAMEQQMNLMKDTALLLGYDLDVNALMYYRTMRTEAENNAPGSRTIYEDLKTQFPGPGIKKAADKGNTQQ